jgi:hypothetical protein
VYVISSLEWPAVEDGLRMIRAKRMFEESRILWIKGNERNETVLDRLGTKVRAVRAIRSINSSTKCPPTGSQGYRVHIPPGREEDH